MVESAFPSYTYSFHEKRGRNHAMAMPKTRLSCMGGFHVVCMHEFWSFWLRKSGNVNWWSQTFRNTWIYSNPLSGCRERSIWRWLKFWNFHGLPWAVATSTAKQVPWAVRSEKTMENQRFQPTSNEPFSATRQRIWVSPSVSESLRSLVYVSWLSESKTPKLMYANNMETSHAK